MLHVQGDGFEVDALAARGQADQHDRLRAMGPDQAAELACGEVEIDRQEMASDCAGELAARVDAVSSPRDETGDEDVHDVTICVEADPFNAGLTLRRYSLTGCRNRIKICP